MSNKSPLRGHSIQGVNGSSRMHRLCLLLLRYSLLARWERFERWEQRMWSKCSLPGLLHGYITGPHYVAPVNQHRCSPACPLLSFYSTAANHRSASCHLISLMLSPHSNVHSTLPVSTPLTLLPPTPTHYFSYLKPFKQSPRPLVRQSNKPCEPEAAKWLGPTCSFGCNFQGWDALFV